MHGNGRLIPHSNATDMIRLTKIRLWTTKGEQKDSKRVPFTQENFVGENTCSCPCSINIGTLYSYVISQFFSRVELVELNCVYCVAG